MLNKYYHIDQADGKPKAKNQNISSIKALDFGLVYQFTRLFISYLDTLHFFYQKQYSSRERPPTNNPYEVLNYIKLK